MKMYIIIAIFIFRERAQRANVLLIIFNFHDNNFFNVIEVLQHFEDFDENINISINNEKVFCYIFIHIFVNDMSQQQENSNFKSQNVNLKCRFYFIINIKRDQLNYNLFKHECFHH